jgi:GTPase Era involved in 16S rRNA processing
LNALDDHEQRDEALLNQFVDWPNFNNVAKNKYNNIVEDSLSKINICDNLCCSIDHRAQIDSNYTAIINALKQGTKDYTVIKCNNFVPVPGWNKHCKQLYHVARLSFLNWLKNGKFDQVLFLIL